MNLMSNALKFTLEGDIKVKVSYREEGKQRIKTSTPNSDVSKIIIFGKKRDLSIENSQRHKSPASVREYSSSRLKEDDTTS